MGKAPGLSGAQMILTAKQNVEVYPEPIEKKGAWSRLLAYVPSPVTRVESGYRFRILDGKSDCYFVEMYSGKVGYVLKDLLVDTQEYRLEDTYPLGSQVIRTSGIQSQPAFFVDGTHSEGISVREEL